MPAHIDLKLKRKGYPRNELKKLHKENAVDSNLMIRCVRGMYPIKDGSESFIAADINGDGQINGIDVNYIKRIILGLYVA